MGGNGPITVTQLMPLIKFTKDYESFLDVGCGSGTTLDAINAIKRIVKYKGIDIIPHRVEWLKNKYPYYQFNPTTVEFAVQHAGKLEEEDKSWDTVWSRHVIDHLQDFEKSMDEHCRVAKKRVICVLWYKMTDDDEHKISHVTYDGVVYEDEYLNQYSKKKVQAYFDNKKDWKVIEYLQDVSWQGDRGGKGQDTIIVMERI
jgi:ubiquinone/menaquinone biosynthesis C-methylase UbiE